MRKLLLAASLVLFFIFTGNVQASNICDYDYVPTYPSVNSTMLLVVPRSTVDTQMGDLVDPSKVVWVVRKVDYSFVDEGSMLKYNDCWVCEFSGKTTDFYGNCGPTPFRTGGSFMLYFTAQDFERMVEFNKTIAIQPEKMASGISVDDSGTVRITADVPINANEVWITLFNAQSGDVIQDFNRTALIKGTYPGRYTMDISSLPVGTYYASFGFRGTGIYGGSVSRFEIASRVVPLSVDTDKGSYWLGEEVEISGQSDYGQVSAVVRFPSGKTSNLGTANVVSKSYNYAFRLMSDYEAGDYKVTVTAGNKTAEKTFSVSKLIIVNPLSLSFSVTDRSSTITKTITVQNTGNSSITLSASSESITNYVDLEFDKTSVAAGSTATLTVTLDPQTLGSDLTGRILIQGGSMVTVPVSVDVSMDITGPVEGPVIKASPAFFSTDNCVVGQAVESSFAIQNTGEGSLDDFNYDLSSSLDGIAEVTLPDSSISPGSTKSLGVKITPTYSSASGSVEVSSNGGTTTLYISLNCADGVSTDAIAELETQVASLKDDFTNAGFDEGAVSSIFYSLDDDLSQASDNLQSGSYAQSKENLMKAQATYDALSAVLAEIGSSGGTPGGGDSSWVTWVVVVVVVVILALVGFFIYSKFGSKLLKKGGGEGEEPYEEEQLI